MPTTTHDNNPPVSQAAPATPPRPWRRHARRTARAAVYTAALAVLLFTAMRLFGLEATWPLRTLVSYTPYIAAAACLPPLAALLLRDRRLAAGAALAPLVLAGLLVPRLLPDTPPDAAGAALRVEGVNLYYGHVEASAVIALADEHRPDVLSVQELTEEAAAALDAAGIGERFPYRELSPGIDASGTGVYSRYPLTRTPALECECTFDMTGVTIAVPGAATGVELLAAHPLAPYEPRVVDLWLDDLARMPRATPDGAVRILAGDFNATLDHAALRDLIGSGYVDAASAAGEGLTGTWQPFTGDRGTFHGLRPPRVALDHVLADERVAVRAVAFAEVAGGDHLSVIADVTLP